LICDTPTPWISSLRQTRIPPELAVLALKTLGVSDEILQQIYGVDIATTIEAALKRGDDSKIPYQLTDPYECDPVDMEAMRELLMTATSSRFRHESLQATWELTNIQP